MITPKVEAIRMSKMAHVLYNVILYNVLERSYLVLPENGMVNRLWS